MQISNTVFWLLIGSLILSLFVMASSILWMYLRRKRIIKRYKDHKPAAKNSPVKVRNNSGELLWESRNKSQNPLDDYQMEFAINTVFRNQFNTFNTVGFIDEYEQKSLTKLAKSKLDKDIYDFLLINGEINNLNEDFDQYYKLLKSNQMIMIVNASRKRKEIKRLLAYLKTIKAKYEWSKYGKGVIVVVK